MVIACATVESKMERKVKLFNTLMRDVPANGLSGIDCASAI